MNGTVKGSNHDYRRNVDKRNNGSYVYGNTVRQMNAAPARRSEQTTEVQRREAKSKTASASVRRNRQRQRQMTMPYVMFLSVVALVTLGVCANYIQLKSGNTAYRAELLTKENNISEAKMLNDATYNNLIASIDLEYVRNVAINKLGMVYAEEGQIISYSSQDSDYIKQYSDVPAK